MTSPEPNLDEPLQSARAHLAAGRFADAEQAYRHHLKRHPGDSDALRDLAEAVYQAGKYQTAVQYLTAAARQAPDVAEYRCDLGRAYRALGDRDRAGPVIIILIDTAKQVKKGLDGSLGAKLSERTPGMYICPDL